MPVLLVSHNSLRMIVLEYLLFSAHFWWKNLRLFLNREELPRDSMEDRDKKKQAGREQDDYGLQTKKLAPFQYGHYLKVTRELLAISTSAQINSSEYVTLSTPGGIWPMPGNVDGPNRLVLHQWVTGILEGPLLSRSLWGTYYPMRLVITSGIGLFGTYTLILPIPKSIFL